ncbi:hypothetical protein Tco_0093768 [Tanacetum coccineum]
MQDKAKESCMESFRLLHSHLKVLSINDLKRLGSKGGYERAFASLFDQDDYDSQMTENYFAEYTGIEVKQFRETLLQHMGNVKKSVAKRTRHKRQYDSKMNERHMQSKEGKVDSSKSLDAIYESSRIESGKQDTSSNLGNYITHVMDACIRPANDQVLFADVQLNAQHNVLANKQQYTEQSKPMYDTYLLKKVDSNTTLDSTNMSHMG